MDKAVAEAHLVHGPASRQHRGCADRSNRPVAHEGHGPVNLTVKWSPSFNGYIVALHMIHFDGAESHTFVVRIDMNAKELQYLNASSSYVKVATLTDIAAKSAYWHVSKLVVDLVNYEYVEFFLDDEVYSLADLKGPEGVDTSTDHIETGVYHKGAPSGNPYINVNDFIFTIDEP